MDRRCFLCSSEWKHELRDVSGNLNNVPFSILCQQFGEGLFLFQKDNWNSHSADYASMVWWYRQEIDWLSQGPDLMPIEQFWPEIECRLRTQPNRSLCVEGFTSVVMDVWKSIPEKNLWKTRGKSFLTYTGCLWCKRGTNLMLKSVTESDHWAWASWYLCLIQCITESIHRSLVFILATKNVLNEEKVFF